MTDDLAFGWDPDKEQLHDLTPLLASISSLDTLTASSEIPDDFDPDWFTQDLQGMWPFCHAHMRTGMEEWLYYLQVHNYVQMSRRFAAITNLRMDGNDKSPTGASIGGSIRAAVKNGNGPEQQLPYFGPKGQDPYSNRIPASFQATSFIKSVVAGIDSYKALDGALITGRAVVGFGMDWYSSFSNIGEIASFDGNPFLGSYLGGHAIFAGGWRTINGDRWPLLHNSHPRFGERRRVALSPKTWDRILKANRFGVFAATDIETNDETPASRSWDWLLTTHW